MLALIKVVLLVWFFKVLLLITKELLTVWTRQ
jgi:hypothetical protein